MSVAAAEWSDFGADDRALSSPQKLRCVVLGGEADRQANVREFAASSRYDVDIVVADNLAEVQAAVCGADVTDLVFLDDNVHRAEGAGPARDLANEARRRAIPIIYTGMSINPETAIRAIRYGAADYLAGAELTTDRFDQAIENALGRNALVQDDQKAMLSNVLSENETLRRISLRNMRLLKAQAMPLLAFAWRMMSGADLPIEKRPEVARRLARLTRNMTGLIDDTVIVAATHRANDLPETLDLNGVVEDVISHDLNELEASRAHIRVNALPKLHARRTHMAMLFEELLLTAVRAARLGEVPDIEIGSSVDPEGNPVIWLREEGLQLSARKQSLAQRVGDLVEPPTEENRDEHSWSLCQRLVEKNRGAFKITENGEHGSRVLIRFSREMLRS